MYCKRVQKWRAELEAGGYRAVGDLALTSGRFVVHKKTGRIRKHPIARELMVAALTGNVIVVRGSAGETRALSRFREWLAQVHSECTVESLGDGIYRLAGREGQVLALPDYAGGYDVDSLKVELDQEFARREATAAKRFDQERQLTRQLRREAGKLRAKNQSLESEVQSLRALTGRSPGREAEPQAQLGVENDVRRDGER